MGARHSRQTFGLLSFGCLRDRSATSDDFHRAGDLLGTIFQSAQVDRFLAVFDLHLNDRFEMIVVQLVSNALEMIYRTGCLASA